MKKVILGGVVAGVIGCMGIVNAGVTRFEFTRQLQQKQCNECYTNLGTLSEQEWNVYMSSAQYGLEDVSFEGNDYYACIESTVVEDLMQGYPRATSPFCAGKFCGSANTIAIDAAEAVLVLLREQVAAGEEIPVTSILQTQKQEPFLTVDQLATLQEIQRSCAIQECVVRSASQLNLLMRWRSQPTVSAPYSDTNRGRTQVLLRRIGVDWSGVSSLQAISQSQIDDLLSPVQRSFQCDTIDDQALLAVDTDQDGIADSVDVCPRVYDPFQSDQDGDAKGDVCDNDIDGDGEENSLGVVDYQGRLDQKKLLTSNDKNPGGIGLQKTIEKITATPMRIVAGESVSLSNNGGAIDYGDGFQGTQLSHVYTQPGRFTIRSNDSAIQIVVDQGSQAVGRIVGGPLVVGVGEAVELSVETDGEIVDQILRQRGSQQELVSPEIAVRIDAPMDQEYIPVRATLLDSQGNEYGVLQTTIANGAYETVMGSQLQSSVLKGSITQSIDFSTRWTGGGVNDVRYIQWYSNGELIDQIYGQDSWSYVFSTPGIYEITQEIYFKDRTQLPHTNILRVGVEGSPSPVIALQTPDQVRVGESFVSIVVFEEGDFEELSSREWFVDGRKTGESGSSFSYVSEEIGSVLIGGGGVDPYGKNIYLQERVDVVVEDNCLDVGRYQCDLDQDGISDICDSDIDGDEIDNPLGVLIAENDDCEITSELIDYEVLRESMGRLGVDVCPFVFDPEQLDENGDGIGDACEGLISGELCFDKKDNDQDGDIDCEDSDCMGLPMCENQGGGDQGQQGGEGGADGGSGGGGDGADSDGDGVPDSEDACPAVSGGSGGCPEIPDSGDQGGGSEIVNPPCVTCPCPMLDRRAELWDGDQVRALLYDESGNILYSHSQPYPIAP